MKLLTKEIRARLPALYYNEVNKVPTQNIVAHVRFFAVWSSWSWWICEYDGDDLFYGFVVGHEPEWGYTSLAELESIRGPGGLGIERDLHFVPTKMHIAVPEHFTERGQR